MEIKRFAFVLVDISGYTPFMRMHTISLIHAEVIITELLEADLDKAEYPLTLSKLEGDAAFLYAVLDENGEARLATQEILGQVLAFFEAFRARERSLIACDTCSCEACENIGQLKLKAFLHVGEALIKKIRTFEELAGESVILIHRLLKNTIRSNEYVLMTSNYFELSGGLAEHSPETRLEDCEGMGKVTVKIYYLGEAEPQLQPRPAPALPKPGTEFGAISGRWDQYAIRRMLGRTPKRSFSHLPDLEPSLIGLLRYWLGGLAGNIRSIMRHRLAQKQRQEETL